MDVTIKSVLYEKCKSYINQRIETAQNAMDAAQQAANEEGKSSAGDKFETGRAMMQLERDKNARQLQEALLIKAKLAQIDPEKTFSEVAPGSLVVTNQGIYFLAISLGKLAIDKQQYFVISPESPIGRQLLHLQKGAEIYFNERKFKIEALI